jgi:hypothetical protein
MLASKLSRVRSIVPLGRGYFLITPGTSCLATIMLSLWDKYILSVEALIRLLMRLKPCVLLFQGEGTRVQTFNVDRCRHGLETSSVRMQKIARAADGDVRLEWGLNGSGRGIKGGCIKIGNVIKKISRSDEVVNLLPFIIYFWKSVTPNRATEARHDRGADHFYSFGMQSLDYFLEAVDHLVARSETCTQIINPF